MPTRGHALGRVRPRHGWRFSVGSRCTGRTGSRSATSTNRGTSVRVLLALGGNAMTAADGSATPGRPARRHRARPWSRSPASSRPATRSSSPTATARRSATCSSRTSSPPRSCRRSRWTGAAPRPRRTIGFTMLDALERGPGRARRVRARWPPSSPAPWSTPTTPASPSPTKPIGRFLPYEQARPLIEHGELWEDRGEKGWRRVVASPEPVEVLETAHAADAARRRLRRRRGRRRRHPGRARRATALSAASRRSSTRTSPPPCSPAPSSADVLVIATDVDHADRRLRHARGRRRSAR